MYSWAGCSLAHKDTSPRGKQARHSAKVLSLISAFQPRLNLPKGRAPFSSLHKLCPTSQMSQAKTGGHGHLKYCDIWHTTCQVPKWPFVWGPEFLFQDEQSWWLPLSGERRG